MKEMRGRSWYSLTGLQMIPGGEIGCKKGAAPKPPFD